MSDSPMSPNSTSSTPDDDTSSPSLARKTPRIILILLVAANIGVSFAPLREGNPLLDWHAAIALVLPIQAWFSSVSSQHVFVQLLLLLLLIPAAITTLAIPLKLRDRQFQLGLVFQMGLFVALIFAIQMMRVKAG